MIIDKARMGLPWTSWFVCVCVLCYYRVLVAVSMCTYVCVSAHELSWNCWNRTWKVLPETHQTCSMFIPTSAQFKAASKTKSKAKRCRFGRPWCGYGNQTQICGLKPLQFQRKHSGQGWRRPRSTCSKRKKWRFFLKSHAQLLILDLLTHRKSHRSAATCVKRTRAWLSE